MPRTAADSGVRSVSQPDPATADAPAGAEALPFIVAVQREIRAPLNALAGVLSELEASRLDERGTELVAMARASTNALNLLTGDLVILAAAPHGEVQTDLVSFDLRVSLDRLSADWAVTEPYGFSLDIEPDVPSRLQGRPTHLRRILYAFAKGLSSPDAPAPLALAVTRTSETATHVQLELTMSRLGLPRADPGGLDDSFDLLVARHLASGLEGELESSAGRFALKVSVRKNEVRAPSAPVARVELAGRRVLIVGSSGPSRVSLQMTLRGLGCEGILAAGVDEAVFEMRRAAVNGKAIDACITDLSGRTQEVEALAQALRDDETLHSTSLIVLLELGSSGDAAWARSLGSAAYLAKPLKEGEFEDVLMELIGRREGDAEQASDSLITQQSIREANAPRLKCLVVDDDTVNLMAVQAMLERLGHRVEIARCGAEALDKTAVQCFDLILIDVRMPDMDGDQVALIVAARQRERNEERTPIFAMTAAPGPGDEQLCIASGILQYHRKPVTIELLNGIVEHVLHNGEGIVVPVVEVAEDLTLHETQNKISREDAIVWDHLDLACHGVPELKTQMIAAFRSQLLETRQRMAILIEEGRMEELESAAEACGSSCAAIGALQAARSLARLEKLAGGGSLSEIRPMFAELLAEFDRVDASMSA